MTSLPLPEIDDRAYDDLVADAISRISVHNPDWTNHNEADPGITILELFAFMTETLLYRSRLIPERNRLAFLRLLGVEVKGATAASRLSAPSPRCTLGSSRSTASSSFRLRVSVSASGFSR